MSAWVGPDTLGLFADFYELTMAAGYHAEDIEDAATFDLFVRRLPPRRRFLVAAGLEDALEYLEGFSFAEADVAYLETLGMFEASYLDYLRGLAFTGEVWAVPEGEIVFEQEPILRVTAPYPQAQLVETFLLNCVAFQTMVASKASRVALACAGRSFVDFSARRDHGADAALKGARAAFIGGAAATSLTVAGRLYGLPVTGTMAHSYVASFPDERDAFRSFAHRFPQSTIMLIDTYDTVAGARKVVEVARELAEDGIRVRGVRIDSGDLDRLSRAVREVLDEGGLPDVEIFVSGDLDEYRIAEMVARDVPVDAFGVGTRLGTSSDAPFLGAVYKLVEDARGPKVKLSPGKVNLPGRKQVFRVGEGTPEQHDVLALAEETVEGRPLLERVMSHGRRSRPSPPLEEARARRASAVAALPSRLHTLVGRERRYDVRLADGLASLLRELGGVSPPE